MSPGTVFAGIDVSKAYLDVAVRPGEVEWRSPNTDTGAGQVADRLKDLHADLVVAGGYQRDGDPGGQCTGGPGRAGRGDKPTPGARLREVNRTIGEDRCPGRPDPCSLR